MKGTKVGKILLTCDHAASSYGVPVAILNGQAYGSQDRLSEEQGTLSDVVRQAAEQEGKTTDGLVQAFLSSAPLG